MLDGYTYISAEREAELRAVQLAAAGTCGKLTATISMSGEPARRMDKKKIIAHVREVEQKLRAKVFPPRGTSQIGTVVPVPPCETHANA
ncbi:MAG TPA: hypothetical protein VF615_25675 [Longimicrobiaceae bacterium]|jgi:DNA-binding IclR family transcriptional regulator